MADILTVPNLAAEVARLRALIAAELTSWSNQDSSVIVYAIEQLVQLRLIDYRLFNSSADAFFVATATGADLDRIMANYDLTRNAGESDDTFRGRLTDQFNALNKDTAESAEVRARQVAGVTDASLDLESATGRNATVYIQGPGYTAPDTALRTAAASHLNDYDWAPWYATFTVPAAGTSRRAYAVRGQGSGNGVWYDESQYTETAMITAITASLEDTELRLRRYNQTVTAFDYENALASVPGVVRANLQFTGTAITDSWTIGANTYTNSADILYARRRYCYTGTIGTVVRGGSSTQAGRIDLWSNI